MAKREILAGATDQTIDVFIQDSSSTTGQGLASLVFNSAGLACYYRKGATGSATALTLATQTVGGAHSDGGFVEIQATNMKGVYRLDLSDTIVATAGMVTIMLYGATNMAPTVAEIEVVSVDKFDSVRMGMTALPNAAAQAAGGLYTRGTGAGQINQPANGLIDVNVENWNTTAVPAEHTAGYPIVTIKDGTGTGEINTNAGAIALVDLVTTTTTVTNQVTANATAISGDTTAADNLEAILDGTGGVTLVVSAITLTTPITANVTQLAGVTQSLTDLKDFADDGYDPSTNKVQGVVLVDTLTTYTGNTPQTGDSFARLGAPAAASIAADIAVVAADNPNRPTRAVQFDNFEFMMVDATDLNTPETGVTVTATISKDGGAFASCSNSVSEISGGWYKITLTATEMTADRIALKFTGTGCAQRNVFIVTQPT